MSPPATPPGTPRETAAEVWRLLSDFTFAAARGGRQLNYLKELGLTPGHLKVFGALRPDEPRPMGALAEAVGCDASMATWLVDRLEERGLVERRPVPADRRVKAVALTPRGRKVRARVFEQLYEPPPELLSLDTETLEALRRELAKLPRPTETSPATASAGRRGAAPPSSS